MTTQENPIAGQFASLHERFKDLYDKIRLPDVSSTITEASDQIQMLPNDIVKVRQRGYVFAAYLEQKSNVLGKRFNDVRHRIENAIETEGKTFQTDYRRLDSLFTEGERLAASSPALLAGRIPTLENQVAELEARIQATERKLTADLGTLPADASQTASQLDDINWYLDQKDEASFKFLAGEALFLAAKAEYVATGKSKDDPDGILYLTDQRLIFEQKETTGKTLGLFGGKKVQEVEWEIPLHQISDVKAENKGFFGGKDMLYFTLKQGAPHAPQITVEVKGGVACKFWAAQVQRMLSGNTKDERAIQPDAEALEAIKKAPSACPSCGGTLPMLVAGQHQIDCVYCGAVIRI
ncbi:MAG: hypothetical protein LCI00_16085 [Chloroflexi bacterium]|nr:hypothetical protein [Chloroflexota bacterium]MCC6892751.1 hypothetical protein [Anaerolineae bacterium]